MRGNSWIAATYLIESFFYVTVTIYSQATRTSFCRYQFLCKMRSNEEEDRFLLSLITQCINLLQELSPMVSCPDVRGIIIVQIQLRIALKTSHSNLNSRPHGDPKMSSRPKHAAFGDSEARKHDSVYHHLTEKLLQLKEDLLEVFVIVDEVFVSASIVEDTSFKTCII
jgi:hypothetical protein